MASMQKLPPYATPEQSGEGPKFVRTNREQLDGEGIFPDSDPVFCPVALVDEQDKSVIRAVAYNGFICKKRNPNLHWIVFAAIDGSELPVSLQGAFTDERTLRAAIDLHVGREVSAPTNGVSVM